MKRAKLEDLFEYLPKSKIKAGDGLGEGEYPFYTSSETLRKYLDDFQHEPGCLVFGTGGKASVHLTLQRFSTSTDCITVRPKPSANIDVEYAFQYFRANMNILENGFKGAGLKHISKAYLSAIEVPHPEDINDQRRIAYLLGRVEGLIAQRKQQLKQLDELLKSVFLEMFGDPVQNERGWNKLQLKAFGKISTGNTPPRADLTNYDSNFVEWIKTDNITSNAVFITPSSEHLSEVGSKKGKSVTKGALLVACIAGSVESIGRAALTDRTVSFNQQINAIQPNQDTNPLYLYCLFKLSRSYVQSHATKGMKKILTKGDFEKILMIKPPLELQNELAVVVEKIEGVKSRYQESLSDIETLYSALSQQAFKGELDLSKITLPEKKTLNLIRSIAPVADNRVAITAKQAVMQLNQFNSGYSETIKNLQSSMSHFSDLNRPLLNAVKTLSEQVFMWRSPFDELKNMPSLTRAFDDISKFSSSSLIGSDLQRVIEESSALSKKIMDIVPTINLDWLKEQQAIMERASAPYASMQNAIAALGIMDNALSATYHSAIPALPDMFDYLDSMQTQLSANSWLEHEPKHNFTHYNILDVLDAAGGSISSKELIQKLSELELITLGDYERIKGLLFGLLNDGAIEQRCEENRVVLSRVAV